MSANRTELPTDERGSHGWGENANESTSLGVASALVLHRSSISAGGFMVRGWQRCAERRRKTAAALLADVVQALPDAREPRMLRTRFQDSLRLLVNAREV